MNTKNQYRIDTTADRIYAFKASCKIVFIAVGGFLFLGGLMFMVAILDGLIGRV